MKILLIIVCFTFSTIALPKDYIIFSIGQEIPMGIDNEINKKNYYVNIGAQQGISDGTVLDVFRTVSKHDPYENKSRYNFKVKIGRLKVLHVEDGSAITQKESLLLGENTALFEIEDFMIGDQVNISVKN